MTASVLVLLKRIPLELDQADALVITSCALDCRAAGDPPEMLKQRSSANAVVVTVTFLGGGRGVFFFGRPRFLRAGK